MEKALGDFFVLLFGNLNGGQRHRPAAEAEGADPVLDHTKSVHKPLFDFPEPPVGNTAPRLHSEHRSLEALPVV